MVKPKANDPTDPYLYVLLGSQVFQIYPPTMAVTLKCTLPGGGAKRMQVPFAMDIDHDLNAELFFDHCVYNINCVPKWCDTIGGPPQVTGATSAVADLVPGGNYEVVMVNDGWVRAFDSVGNLLWSTQIGNLVSGGTPAIADVDGDGIPDVGVSNGNQTIFILSGVDGSPLSNITSVSDDSSITGVAMFDFQRDGKSELIVCGVYDCNVFGTNWRVSAPTVVGTGNEYPVMVDIDLDGEAEMVTSGYTGFTIYNGSDVWPGTRSVWNQHAYSPLNVDDQGGFMLAQGSSSFRSNPP